MTVQKVPFNFVGGYGKSRQGGISPARTINMYITSADDNQVSPALLGTPGLEIMRTVEDLGTRGGVKYQNKLYMCVGTSIYQVPSPGNLVYIGTIATFSGYVEMCGNNGNQVFIVDGGNGYIYNTQSGDFVMITDPDFPINTSTCCFLDGYFITNSFGTRQWNLSGLNNGLVWDALQAQNMSYGWDTVQSLKVLKGLLWVMGARNIETWANPGTVTALFPLVQNTNFRFQQGVAAPGSVVQISDMMIWVGNDDLGTKGVMMSNGGEPELISTFYVNQSIQSYQNVSDGRAYFVRENGHDFYAVNFTFDDQSWLFDMTAQYWTEQQMLDGSRHVVAWCGSLNNINICGGYNNGNIYQLDQSFYTNAGEVIHRRRITDRFKVDSLQEIKVDALVLDMESGLCLPGTNPTLFLSVSKDAGKNFGPSIPLSIGMIGNYINQLQALNLGLTRDLTYALDFYEQFDFVLRDAAQAFEVVGN